MISIIHPVPYYDQHGTTRNDGPIKGGMIQITHPNRHIIAVAVAVAVVALLYYYQPNHQKEGGMNQIGNDRHGCFDTHVPREYYIVL